MRILADLAGTLRNALRIGRATIAASTLSAPRTVTVPDQDIDLTPNSSFQAFNQNLSALSGLSGAANKAPYFTAAGAMAVYDLTVFGRAFAAAADQAAGRTLLGLSTAATRAATTSATDTTSERLWRTNDLVKQTSQTDTTSGSVMLNGAHGLGSVLSNEPAIADFATIRPSGFYRALGAAATGATANAPAGSGNSQLGVLCVRILSNTCYYYVFENGGSPATRKFWLGQNNSGTVTWQQVYHDGNFDPGLKANLASPSFTGNVTIGNAFQANAGSTGIEVGRTDGTAGTGYIDFHAGATPTDYDARIQCTSGNGNAGQGAISIGGGTVLLNASVGASRLQFAGADKLATSATGITVSGQVESSLPVYTNLTLQSPYTWDAAGDAADYNQPSYTKVDNVVRLRGKVTLSGTHTSNATVNVTTIATLPVGFRPLKRKAFQVFWDTDSPLFFAYCLVFVNTNGTIVLVAPASNQPYPFTEGHLPLDQIWFDLAA